MTSSTSSDTPASDQRSIPLLDLNAQHAPIRAEIERAIASVLDSNRFILGAEVEALEKEIADVCGCAHGVGVSSGTDALLVSLMAANIGPGDEVITSPYTFFATAGSIARVGAQPVFVDIDPLTYNITPKALDDAVTSRTKAIMPVHLYGQTTAIDGIAAFAQKHNLLVIEDAAQAIGAECHGKRAGSLGDLGCLSFFPSKNLGALGDGGMVVTNNADLADRVRLLRTHGHRPKYYNSVIGGNFRLDALQAAVLRVKLRYLDQWTAARQQNAERYRQLFAEKGLVVTDDDSKAPDWTGVVLPTELEQHRHVYNQFVVRVPQRDNVKTMLREYGIATEIYYPVPLHLQPCFADLGYGAGDLPEAERAAAQTLALPIYPGLNEAALTTVVDRIAEALKRVR